VTISDRAPTALVLDSLFDGLDVEAETAQSMGWRLERWSGQDADLAGADAVLHVKTQVDAALLKQLDRCRAVGRFGTGLDTVDQAAAAALRMPVVNVPDYCTPELAVHSLALGFALVRRLPDLAAPAAMDRSWTDVAAAASLPGGLSAAVVGLGAVGRAVASGLVALGYSVLGVGRPGGALPSVPGVRAATLDEAMAEADVVFLHSALTPQTRSMIDAARLERAKPGLVLVNTARLGLIDEQAVADALDSGHLGGVGIDAVLPRESPLRAMAGRPELLITPHVGWYSERSAHELRVQAVRRTIAAAGAHDEEGEQR
jgi:D-3-phosphoglycerate dehydrogenase / 2-oxoglutarate reductase